LAFALARLFIMIPRDLGMLPFTEDDADLGFRSALILNDALEADFRFVLSRLARRDGCFAIVASFVAFSCHEIWHPSPTTAILLEK
jgi:hypothetical protein